MRLSILLLALTLSCAHAPARVPEPAPIGGRQWLDDATRAAGLPVNPRP